MRQLCLGGNYRDRMSVPLARHLPWNDGCLDRPGSIQGLIDFPGTIIGATPHQQADLTRDEKQVDPHELPFRLVLESAKSSNLICSTLVLNLRISSISQNLSLYYYSRHDIKGETITRMGEIASYKKNYTYDWAQRLVFSLPKHQERRPETWSQRTSVRWLS